MVTKIEKQIIQKLSKKYRAKRVLLFGSSLDSSKYNNDIDLAVEGIDSKFFFKYYGDLLINLSKPVDLIDLSKTSKFIDLIKQEGFLLYG